MQKLDLENAMREAAEQVLRAANDTAARVMTLSFSPRPSVVLVGESSNALTSAILEFQTVVYAAQSALLESGQAIARVEYNIVNTRDNKQYLGYFKLECRDDK